MASNLKLITPEAKYLDSYLASLVEDKGEDAKNEFLTKLDSYDNGLQGLCQAQVEGGELQTAQDGVTYPKVPETWFWLVDTETEEYLGSIRVRSKLNNFLKEYGGHVGYDVRSAQRRKGYASIMLELLKQKLPSMGLSRVFMTCDEGNIASQKVIEKNGGVLQDIVQLSYRGVPLRRYWLEI